MRTGNVGKARVRAAVAFSGLRSEPPQRRKDASRTLIKEHRPGIGGSFPACSLDRKSAVPFRRALK
jgi:hypothetical protein